MRSDLQVLQHAVQGPKWLINHCCMQQQWLTAQQRSLCCSSRQLSGNCCAEQPPGVPAEAVPKCTPARRSHLHKGTAAWALSRV